jgi:hypothetical protein
MLGSSYKQNWTYLLSEKGRVKGVGLAVVGWMIQGRNGQTV